MSWYHATMYDAGRPAGSLWEETAPALADGADLGPNGEDVCDIAIIGGGFTGLSCALHLARDSGADVRLLEAGPLAWGASGRNGGFCILQPTGLSYDSMISRYGEAEAKRFVASQVEATRFVRAFAEDEKIDIEPQGEGELHVAHAPSRYAGLAHERDVLNRTFGIAARLIPREEVAAEWYDSSEQFGALHVPVGFGLHPLRLARGLAAVAARSGAKLHGGSPVIRWEKEGRLHRLATPSGHDPGLPRRRHANRIHLPARAPRSCGERHPRPVEHRGDAPSDGRRTRRAELAHRNALRQHPQSPFLLPASS